MKKILIISNNVLSSQNNNGKTLLSFFKNFPKQNINQLYFSNESVEGEYASEYYRISDHDVFSSLYLWSDKAGAELSYKEKYIGKTQEEKDKNLNDLIRKSDSARLMREFVWKCSQIDYVNLFKWIDKVSPDLIFFCAGDSLFAYDIYQAVCNHTPVAKKVIYITDDYVAPRKKLSPSWWLRRKLVYSKMKNAVIKSDIFVTISEEMRSEYKNLFGKDSIVSFNMSENIKIEDFNKEIRSDFLLVYAGGLHFKRWETLVQLAEALKEFNKKNNRSVKLEVYSHQFVKQSIKDKLNILGASMYCGGLDAKGVLRVLNNADVLVHVESFSKECIESTRLSISTKIAEYISVGSKILAIGPSKVASMRFLDGHACCINSFEEIPGKLNSFLIDKRYCEQNWSSLKNQMKLNQKNFKTNILD